MNVNTGEIVTYDVTIPTRDVARVTAMSVPERKAWAAKKLAEKAARRAATKRARKSRQKSRA